MYLYMTCLGLEKRLQDFSSPFSDVGGESGRLPLCALRPVGGLQQWLLLCDVVGQLLATWIGFLCDVARRRSWRERSAGIVICVVLVNIIVKSEKSEEKKKKKRTWGSRHMRLKPLLSSSSSLPSRDLSRPQSKEGT